MTDDSAGVDTTYLRGCCGAAGVARFEPGQSYPKHYHRAVTEVFVCTMGTISIRIGDDVHHLEPGQTATAPPGVIHHTVNISDSTAEIFYVKTPPAMDDFVFVPEVQRSHGARKEVTQQ